MKRYLFFTILLGLFLFSIPVYANAASLSLSSASTNYEVGDIFNVNIILDAQGQPVQGVDIRYLNYDPSFLEVLDADSQTNGVQIKAGSLMPNTNANSVSGGKILFSQSSSGSQSFNGSGVLATIKFKVLKSGSTQLSFDFIQNSSMDTNIASNGQDILTSVSQKSFTFSEKTQVNDTEGPIKIYLSPQNAVYGVGDSFSVNIIIDTKGRSIDAADIILKYNSKVLEVLDSDQNKEGVQIKNGNILDNIQINEVDKRRSTINFSKTTNQSSTYSGAGVLATINFRAIDKGKAYVKFYFKKNYSRYTNLVSDGKNILEEAVGGLYLVSYDNLPLLVYNRKPSGTVFADRYQTVSVKTNKKAYCRYSFDSGLNYDSMRKYLRTRDGINHYARLRMGASGSSTFIYVKCQDKSKNYTSSSDYIINFTTIKPPELIVQGETPLKNKVEIELFLQGSLKPVYSFSARANRAGRVRLPRDAILNPGHYDISVKSKNTLKNKVSGVFLGAASEVVLPKLIAGDVNGDGVINSIDWSLINTRWFKRDYNYDINGDRIINSIDWSFIKKNWLKRGDI